MNITGTNQSRRVLNLINAQASPPLNNEVQLMAKNASNSMSTNWQFTAGNGVTTTTAIGTGSFAYTSTALAEKVLCTAGAVGARYFYSSTMTFLAGHTYVVTVMVESSTGVLTEPWLTCLLNANQISYGTLSVAGVPRAGNRYGILFTPNVTTSALVRMGVGATVAVTAVCSIELSMPMVQDITDIGGIAFDRWWPASVYGTRYKPSASFNSGTSGLVTDKGLAYDTSRPTPALANWLLIGDSFMNDFNDPPFTIPLRSKFFCNGAGYTGERIRQRITTELAWNLKQAPFDGLVIEGGLNNVRGGDSLDTMQAEVNAVIDIAIAGGIKTSNMVLVGMPGCYRETWSPAIQVVMDGYNLWLQNLAIQIGAQFVDLYSVVGGSDKRGVKVRYSGADGLHLNFPEGNLAFADAIIAAMTAADLFAAT